MSGHRIEHSWQSNLIDCHPGLFTITANGRRFTPGSPTVGDGWREIVETAVDRVAAALAAAPSGAARIVQIKEEFGCLRLYWHSTGLSDEVGNAIDEVVALAEARSACTREICGAEGRLYDRGGWPATACTDHARGEPVPAEPGFEVLHVRFEKRLPIVWCRRYVRETDSFVDMDQQSLGGWASIRSIRLPEAED